MTTCYVRVEKLFSEGKFSHGRSFCVSIGSLPRVKSQNVPLSFEDRNVMRCGAICVLREEPSDTNLTVNVIEHRFIRGENVIASVVIPISWVPQDQVVRRWFPMKGTSQGWDERMYCLVEVHRDTVGAPQFSAPAGDLMVQAGWVLPFGIEERSQTSTPACRASPPLGQVVETVTGTSQPPMSGAAYQCSQPPMSGAAYQCSQAPMSSVHEPLVVVSQSMYEQFFAHQHEINALRERIAEMESGHAQEVARLRQEISQLTMGQSAPLPPPPQQMRENQAVVAPHHQMTYGYVDVMERPQQPQYDQTALIGQQFVQPQQLRASQYVQPPQQTQGLRSSQFVQPRQEQQVDELRSSQFVQPTQGLRSSQTVQQQQQAYSKPPTQPQLPPVRGSQTLMPVTPQSFEVPTYPTPVQVAPLMPMEHRNGDAAQIPTYPIPEMFNNPAQMLGEAPPPYVRSPPTLDVAHITSEQYAPGTSNTSLRRVPVPA